MKQSNIFKPTLKFTQKTSVSNVNVSNDNFRLSKASSVSLFGPVLLACFISLFYCLHRIRGKIRLDCCKNQYYTNNTQGSHSFKKQS